MGITYPGEEYFLFPNWNNAKGCGKAFWIGKYMASNENGVAVSKKGRVTWVNKPYYNDVINICNSKGSGFHCMRNREWVSIALWTQHIGITVYGNIFGYTQANNMDRRGIGTTITSSIADTTNSNDKKILTGMGPVTFRHNGRMDGISDLAGNAWETVEGLRYYNGTLQLFNENNAFTTQSNNIATTTYYDVTYGRAYNFINSSTNDLLNEGLPVNSGGMQIRPANSWIGTAWLGGVSGHAICMRGGSSRLEGGNSRSLSPADYSIWAIKIRGGLSYQSYETGFRLARTL